MRGRTRLLSLLGLSLFLPLVMPSPVAAQPEQSTVFFTLEQGDFSTTLTPLRDAQSVADFYNYSNFQSNTGIEVLGRSLVFLYENTDSGEISLVIIHGLADGGPGTVSFRFSGLPQGVQFQVQDDPDDSWTLEPPTAQVDWSWEAGFNDGTAIGPLSRAFEITISPDFVSGIQEWAALTGTIATPESRLIPSLTEPITIRAHTGPPPTADFTFSPSRPGAGVPVSFDARASRPAPGREIVRYEWDFNGDGIFEVSTTNPTIQHTFDDVGTFRVTLKVTDDRGVTATMTKTVEIVEISARAVRSISTPEAAVGYTFRITVEIQMGVPVNGLGLDEDLPPGFEVTPVDNAGATFKRAQTQWVWAEMIQANEIRRIVYDVTVKPEAVIGPLPRCFELGGFIESASPAFLTDVTGESQICLVDCLSIPVAVAHLTMEGVVDLRLDERINADQLQRAVSFWLEEAGVPGTCNAIITWEMMKGLVARQLDAIPVDEDIPVEANVGARVTRTILAPLPFFEVYLPNEKGRVFRVRLDIELQRELKGFGIKEILPLGWQVRPIQNDGAVFKRATREWVFTERLSPEFNRRKTIIYEVIVPESESTGCVRIQGKSQAVRPQFEAPTGGDNEICMVECLSVPVAIAHLDTRTNSVDVTFANLIEFDQIQAAIAFWLEDVSVPGTCGKVIDFETMKALIAHWLTDTPVDRPLPGGVSTPQG